MSKTPDDLKYSKDHEWVKLDGDLATVGISDYAQEQLTDVVFVELPEIGKEVEKDKNMANVESVKSVSDIFSPVSGQVTEVNKKLSDAPETINSDCYGEGWIVKIKLKDNAEIDSLMSAKEYEEHIK